MSTKSINVPFIENLEKLSPCEFDSIMEQKASSDSIDVVNWPSQFGYCPKTAIKVARSKDYLAVCFDVQGMDLRATEMEDNGNSWEDSCCEFFVSPKEGYYYNIETTCIGSVRIGYGTGRDDRDLLPNQEVAKVIRRSTLEFKRYEIEGGDHKWGLRLLIPFEVIGLDSNNLPSELGCNFYKCADLSAHPHFVSWNPISTENPDFHRPEFFGKLILK